MRRSIPPEITTGCPELDLVWSRYAKAILSRPGILIRDTDDDLTWHAFLGHSIDMQGFRAAEFAGVDPLSRQAPQFTPLRQLGIGVPELAALWKAAPIQQHLLRSASGVSLRTTLEILRVAGGSVGKSLANAFESFPWRKGNWTVRALLQNSAVLEDHGFSFRRWLQYELAQLTAGNFPPVDFREIIEIPVSRYGRPSIVRTTAEAALRHRLQATFYMVGPALSSYMICDWQLWLWNECKTDVFATYKQDSFHEEFVKRYGRDLVPSDQDGFTDWWFSMNPDVPPRLANECIWLGMEEHRAGRHLLGPS